MEKIEFPLSKFTFAQKFNLLETILGDFSKNDEAFESPVWHEKILNERRETFAAVTAQYSDWSEAKERIKRNLSCS